MKVETEIIITGKLQMKVPAERFARIVIYEQTNATEVNRTQSLLATNSYH